MWKSEADLTVADGDEAKQQPDAEGNYWSIDQEAGTSSSENEQDLFAGIGAR